MLHPARAVNYHSAAEGHAYSLGETSCQVRGHEGLPVKGIGRRAASERDDRGRAAEALTRREWIRAAVEVA